MEIECYEDTLEQEAINRYLNMIANDYDGKLAKIFQEKYINKDKEIKRLNNIINVLEKELDRNIELNYYKNNIRQYNKTLTMGAIMYRDYIKEKLQELKGDSSDE